MQKIKDVDNENLIKKQKNNSEALKDKFLKAYKSFYSLGMELFMKSSVW